MDSSIQQRAAKRRQNIKIKKTFLHDDKEHHSFHIELSDKQSFELLAEISKKRYFEETGKDAPNNVDKTKVRFITLDERYKYYSTNKIYK